MPHSTRSSSTSAPCRLERRASRLLAGALLLLGLAAAFAVLASEMPRAAAWPLALAALGYGAWLARGEARKPAVALVIAGDGTAMVDGRRVDALSVRWRGPAAFVQWRGHDGRHCRHVFLPDTLPAARRRELRLAAPPARPARRAGSMAP